MRCVRSFFRIAPPPRAERADKRGRAIFALEARKKAPRRKAPFAARSAAAPPAGGRAAQTELQPKAACEAAPRVAGQQARQDKPRLEAPCLRMPEPPSENADWALVTTFEKRKSELRTANCEPNCRASVGKGGSRAKRGKPEAGKPAN